MWFNKYKGLHSKNLPLTPVAQPPSFFAHGDNLIHFLCVLLVSPFREKSSLKEQTYANAYTSVYTHTHAHTHAPIRQGCAYVSRGLLIDTHEACGSASRDPPQAPSLPRWHSTGPPSLTLFLPHRSDLLH